MHSDSFWLLHKQYIFDEYYIDLIVVSLHYIS